MYQDSIRSGEVFLKNESKNKYHSLVSPFLGNANADGSMATIYTKFSNGKYIQFIIKWEIFNFKREKGVLLISNITYITIYLNDVVVFSMISENSGPISIFGDSKHKSTKD